MKASWRFISTLRQHPAYSGTPPIARGLWLYPESIPMSRDPERDLAELINVTWSEKAPALIRNELPATLPVEFHGAKDVHREWNLGDVVHLRSRGSLHFPRNKDPRAKPTLMTLYPSYTPLHPPLPTPTPTPTHTHLLSSQIGNELIWLLTTQVSEQQPKQKKNTLIA